MSQGTMGDFLPPKKRDVVDRLRRRIEHYRRRQNGCQQRYEYGQNAVYEQERRHALLLRQKWLESKAKKASKSKTKTDAGHTEQRNQIVTKRLKHKLDGQANFEGQPPTQAENVYRFDDEEAPPAKKLATPGNLDGQLSSVSVHIVHQINAGNSQQEQKISTNVTVNSTITPQGENDADVKANFECKQEPSEDTGTSNAANNSDSVNSDDLDPIEDILSTFKSDDEIPQDIYDELCKFDEIYRSVKDSEGSESGTPGLNTTDKMFAQDMYMDPSQGAGQVRTPPVQQFRQNPPQQPSSTLAESGLAAETLKQMAAQHQHHHPGTEPFGVKSAIDPFSDLSETGQFNTARNGFSPEYQQQQFAGTPRSGSAGPYPGQSNVAPGYPNKQNIPAYGASSGGPKPLTHYSHNAATSQPSESGPSSLQQLQNQVAHFNQGPQMEITQTQHTQISAGSHQMQMSQTQRVALRQPVQNISLTQQQGFSPSPNMGANMTQSPPNMGANMTQSQQNMGANMTQSQQNFMSEQMAMQQQQMMQSKMHPDQRQATQAAGHMPGYMNRPPPEYKMNANGMTGGMPPTGMPPAGMGPNPLQTMQNMVNQTNTQPNPAYASVKSESSDIQMQNGMRTAQMMQQQQQMASVPSMSASQTQLSYQNQHMQRQGSFPGAMGHPVGPQRPTMPNTPTYTSAIMRNQRPPNVNVGPDGLNISQTRNPHEWAGSRAMMPISSQGPRSGSPVTSANMMHYRSFSTDGQQASAVAAQMQMHQQRPMQMAAMQSQQAAMLQQQQQQQSGHAQQMMMQQQRMQMVQRTHSNQTPPYNMGSPAGNTFPHSSASQDDILNLLDTAPNQSTDFFDVQTSGGGSEANWYDIDDIIGSTK